MKRNCTVLYVEDNEDDMHLINEAVNRCHPCFQINWVSNTSAARDYLLGQGEYSDRASHPFPAFVLSDYSMPGGTGQDLLDWVRNQPSCADLGVVLLTSSPQPELVEQAYQSGVNAFLGKQGGLKHLVQLVQCLDNCLQAQPPDFAPLQSLPGYHPAKVSM